MTQDRFSLGREVLASLVVFLVALPLCMGISVACGVPAYKGLLTGIIGGIVVGSLAGCRLQVSGPAAGLTVTVIELVQSHGLAALGPVVAAAGLLQLLAGSFKLGRVFLAVSPAVIRAMLSGIGIIIVLSQVHILLDHKPHGGAVANLLALPAALTGVFTTNADGTMSQHTLAALIGTLTVLCMVGWKLLKLDNRWHLPEALPAIVLGTVVALLCGLPIERVDVPDSLGEMLAPTSLGQFSILADLAVLKIVLSLAIIASAETLLSTASVDSLSKGRSSDYNKEMRAQGIGNFLCGLLGALPLTGVIVRSMANLEAGARTRLSAILHGVWLVLAIGTLPWVLELIPTCTLAGLLVVTGIKLIDWSALRALRQFGWGEVVVFTVTVLLIVTTDLLIGVGVGLLMSLALVVWKVIGVHVEICECGARHEVHLSGAATFISKPLLSQKLETVPAKAAVHIHFDKLLFIDHACLELLNDWAGRVEKNGGSVVVDWTELSAKVNKRMMPAGKKDDKRSDPPTS